MVKARAYDPVKRALDILASVVGIALTAPVQAFVALLIRRKLGTPVLFRQRRPGRNEAVFEMVKFRTMIEPDAARGLVGDEVRMTRFGSLLRSTSLDELPTLWNVLKGDMSLVGPRPLLPQYLERYTRRQSRRHEVRPGITGLAQVNGRNALLWSERLELDVQYVERRSLALDCRILIKTVGKVIRRDGISDAVSPTMTEFAGTRGDLL